MSRFPDKAADLWKQMIRLLPIWATTILFWTAYSQLITFSVEQASTMNRSIWGFQIPAGSLTAFFVVAILVTLGIYDPLVRPLWRKWTGEPGILLVTPKTFKSTLMADVLISIAISIKCMCG